VQRTAEHDGRFIRISFMGLAIFAAFGLLNATVRGEENPPTKDKPAASTALRQVCGAGVSPAWFNHDILGRRDARTTIIRKPGGEPQ